MAEVVGDQKEKNETKEQPLNEETNNNNENSTGKVVPNPYNPKAWGPSTWKLLHTIAGQYPDRPSAAERTACSQLFFSLCYLLPCPNCRIHYTAMLGKRTPDVSSGPALQKYVLWMHNEVNQRLGNGKKQWTLEEMQDLYPPVDELEFDTPRETTTRKPSIVVQKPVQPVMQKPVAAQKQNQKQQQQIRLVQQQYQHRLTQQRLVQQQLSKKRRRPAVIKRRSAMPVPITQAFGLLNGRPNLK